MQLSIGQKVNLKVADKLAAFRLEREAVRGGKVQVWWEHTGNWIWDGEECIPLGRYVILKSKKADAEVMTIPQAEEFARSVSPEDYEMNNEEHAFLLRCSRYLIYYIMGKEMLDKGINPLTGGKKYTGENNLDITLRDS